MSVRACLALSILAALLGAGLRLAVPVTPVDAAFRDVIAFYRDLGPAPAH